MDKTIIVQVCLTLVVLYGLTNVVYTEISGNGLCSTLKSNRHHSEHSKGAKSAACKKTPTAIYLDIKRIPCQKRTCFKYFTAQNGTWVETCIPGKDTAKNYLDI